MLPPASPSLTSTGFGIDAAGDVAQAHPVPPRGARTPAVEERRVRVERLRLLVPSRRDRRHARSSAAWRHRCRSPRCRRSCRCACPSGTLTGDRTPRVEEVEQDRRRGAGHAIDARVAFIGHAPAGVWTVDVDSRPGIDVEDANASWCRPLRESGPARSRTAATPDEHVSAVRPRVDRPMADAHLREEIVDVAARLGRARHDGDLAVQRAAAAHAVELERVGGADGADQRLVTRLVVRRAATRAGRRGRATCRRA